MADMFNQMAGRLKNSPWIWVFFLLFVVLFLISLGLFVEDFSTSLAGYQEWPTAKANWWVVYLVALLPQVGQVAFAYAFIDKRNPEYALVMGLFFLWDLTTDVYYKSFQFRDPTTTLMATFESVPLFTLGSEMLMAFSLGMIRATWSYLKVSATHPPAMTSPRPTYMAGPPTPPPHIPVDRVFQQRPRRDK